MAEKKLFKYYPESFEALKVKVKHMDLVFDVFDDHTIVDCKQRILALENISSFSLNAHNLDIKSMACDKSEITYDYNKDEKMILIKFKKAIKKGTEFIISSKNSFKPTKNILEGLYFDETPKGAPPTQITQCQQWGFQRMVPTVDDMTTKCTYKTTIIADERYTNMITNGDVVEEKKAIGKGRAKIVYENMITPMATYLFFLGVGTYDTHKKEFEYPDGDKFDLEMVVFPKTDKTIVKKALDILNDCIMWIYLFTGPDTYENNERSLKIKSLIEKRDELKEKLANKKDKDQKETSAELEKVRKELKNSIKGMRLGYKYTGTVYREIAMQNSNFGGMENVGNTTITANRMLPFEDITDSSFEYMVKVKVHEFYHNLNGSEVTGFSPFEFWLNEALTVFIEKQYCMFLFGKDYQRLSTMLTLLNPNGGTFAEDESVTSMPIVPDGFNNPDELVNGVTYVKSPEFIRMLYLVMGKEKFTKVIDSYHRKFTHSNARTADWLRSMEESSGLNLKKMSDSWLRQTGYPKVYVKQKFNSKNSEYELTLEQKGFKKNHWEFPIDVSVFDKSGNEIENQLFLMRNIKETITFEGVNKDDFGFLSINRGGSFFGKVFYDAKDEELLLQAKKDTDIVNRYMAFYRLFDKEKTRLIINPKAEVNRALIELYMQSIRNEELTDSVGSLFLAIVEGVEDGRFTHHYDKLYEAKKKIMTSIAKENKDELIAIYNKYKKKEHSFKGPYVETESKKIKARQIKNTCLGVLSRLDTPDIHKMAREQFLNFTSASDKLFAYSCYIDSSAKDKLDIIKKFETEATKNLVAWESFLSVTSRIDSDDAIDIIKRLEKSKNFRIEQSNDMRALYLGFVYNRKRSLLTDEGRAFLSEILIKITKVNEYIAGHVLELFGNIEQMEEKHRIPLIKILVDSLKVIDKKEKQSIYNTTIRILKLSPSAVKEYEKKYGKIVELK